MRKYDLGPTYRQGSKVPRFLHQTPQAFCPWAISKAHIATAHAISIQRFGAPQEFSKSHAPPPQGATPGTRQKTTPTQASCRQTWVWAPCHNVPTLSGAQFSWLKAFVSRPVVILALMVTLARHV